MIGSSTMGCSQRTFGRLTSDARRIRSCPSQSVIVELTGRELSTMRFSFVHGRVAELTEAFADGPFDLSRAKVLYG